MRVPPQHHDRRNQSPTGRKRTGTRRAPPGPRLPRARTWGRGTKLLALAGALAIVGSGGGGTWLYITGSRSARADLLTHTVRYEKLQLSVVERGALESAENSDVVCRVKAGTKGSTVATTIKWVIDDGSHVKRGQVVAE